MTFGLLLAAAVAGAAYVLSPGPAFLALLGIGAGQGRRAGALFLTGHLVGDTLWAFLSLLAIIGAQTIGSFVFDALGLACGAYLIWLGARAIAVRRDDVGGTTTDVRRPLARGLVFGLSNPKAYPVSVAMFTAVLGEYADSLGWRAFGPLLMAALVGFVCADGLLIAVIGARAVRQAYRRHALLVTRISGVLFVGFGLHAIASALPGLLRG